MAGSSVLRGMVRATLIGLLFAVLPARSWSQDSSLALDSGHSIRPASVAGLTHRLRPEGRLTAEERAMVVLFSREKNALENAIISIPEGPNDSTLSQLKQTVGLYITLREKAGSPKLMGALVSEEDFHLLIGHANTLRNIPLSLYLIDEAKAAHPFGRYATPKNCKHP